MSLDGFAGHIHASKETIIARWQNAVCQAAALPSARDLPQASLRNSLPDLLDEIADAIAGTPTPGVEAGAREHGSQRWGAGYDLAEVMREVSILRQVLVNTLEEYAAQHHDLTSEQQWDAMRRILTVIDRAGRAAAAQFHGEAVAEREHSLEALRISEERLREISARARCLLWYAEVEDWNEELLRWNMTFPDVEAARRFFPIHQEPDQDYQTAWYYSRLEEDRQRSDAYGNTQVRAGRSFRQEFRCRRQDGEIRWLSEDVQVEPLGPGRWRAVGVCTDITERRQAEEAARQSNERLQLLTHAVSQILLHEQPEEYIRSVFHQLSTLLGLEVYFNYWVSADGTSLRLASCAGVSEEVAGQLHVLEFGQAICGGVAESGRSAVVNNVAASTDPHTFLLRSLGITAYACLPLIAGDRLLGTLSFGTRKRAQFEPHELELMQTLSHQIAVAVDRAQLIAELRRRAEELALADHRKDQFMAMLAHELRNPLTPIRNAAELLCRARGGDPQVDRHSRIIDRQIQHMVRLLDDLLDVSRITRGKIDLRKIRLDLVRLARDTVEDHRAVIEAAGLTLTLDLPNDPVWVEGDPTRLSQVVSNLLQNAVKFTEPGGQVSVEVRSGGGSGSLRTPATHSAGTRALRTPAAALSVRDTGLGIEPEMLPQLFDTFTQADRTLHRSAGGLGLGLALVKGLVDLHHGDVRAVSEGAGRGAEFIVRLPLHAAPAPPAEAAPPSALRTGPIRVLIVEDNRDAAGTLQELLETAGCTVAVAHTGPSGVETARRFRPEVVLCDLGLPGMDGYEVAATMRRDPALQDVRLIALTGYGQDEDRRRSQEAGFDLHLTKPVAFQELQRLLEVTPGNRVT